jgi:hypothetical protein
MPPVRTLTGNKTAATQPAETTLTPATNPNTGGALALPSWASQAPALPEVNSGGGSAYVGQVQENSKNRATCKAAGVELGEFYLSGAPCNSGNPTALKPFKFWLLDAAAFKTEMDAAGDILRATRDMEQKEKGLEEHVIAIVLVEVGGAIYAAKCDFRKAQCPAYVTAVKAVSNASHPDFAHSSDAARVAAQFPAPWGRVVTVCNPERRNSRRNGKQYYAAVATARPATVSELEALAAYLQAPETHAEVERARDSFKSRVAHIEKHVK